MQVTLEVTSGASAGKTAVVKAGQTLKVGRVAQADLLILDDPMMSNVHFALSCDAGSCKITDQGSRFGTIVNGKKVSEATLTASDTITAGRTSFVLRFEGVAVTPFVSPPVAVAAKPRTPGSQPVITISPARDQTLRRVLCSQAEMLYALLDAARDPAVLPLLRGSGEEHASLYEEKVEELAPFGPFLVGLHVESPLLETLSREAWGKSWGLYLASATPFREVRKHFRRFLLVKLEGGKEVYFRFYDPRVLRTYLPTCTPEEMDLVFGPVSAFYIESGNPEMLLKFTRGSRGVKSQPIYINQEVSDLVASPG